ncbi:hypothetical protein PR202_gb07449 [Eleusine coracana subsp. coracana]|uniref:Uncharacterized protein n=1 Tax=Eleusine coracana subsp. coracana TaxID=191504 RepID=A0AAV5EBK6_ELECO|nr:hypothetical protein PR202_gb07449 [Eleusine coracana subsp. coracana]
MRAWGKWVSEIREPRKKVAHLAGHVPHRRDGGPGPRRRRARHQGPRGPPQLPGPRRGAPAGRVPCAQGRPGRRRIGRRVRHVAGVGERGGGGGTGSCAGACCCCCSISARDDAVVFKRGRGRTAAVRPAGPAPRHPGRVRVLPGHVGPAPRRRGGQCGPAPRGAAALGVAVTDACIAKESKQ